MLPDTSLTHLAGIPIRLTVLTVPGKVIYVNGSTFNQSAQMVMHPLDYWEMGTAPGSIERLRKGLDYLIREANRKLDQLESRL